MTQWVYLFDKVAEAEKHAGDWEAVRGLLGGKGANLAEMTRIGIPVPPGFTATTEACLAYLEAGNEFPEGLWEQELAAMKTTEELTGKNFGDPKNPLLVSCRSGAKFSMPGMMDTVLNLGMNDEVAESMVAMTGDARFVYDAYRRLVQMFGSVVLGINDENFEHPMDAYKEEKGYASDTDMTAADWKEITEKFKVVTTEAGFEFPQDSYIQLKKATEAVFSSWNGKRAIDYRNADNISHDLGTAVNIQTMVFGNMDNSGTGVAFTRNPATGENVNWGEYLMNAQGEDVVAGIRNAKEIAEMKDELPEAYADFIAVCDKLELHYREMQDVEFTVEHGKLWMLQTRNGKRTAKAAVTIAVEMANEGLISKEEAVSRVQPEQVDTLLHPQFVDAAKKAADEEGKMFATGVNASPGAAVGRVYFDADTAESKAKEEGQDVIMVRPFTKPDDVHGMLAAKGILTSEGGATSHAAVVARQFGIPCVVGASTVRIDAEKLQFTSNGVTVSEGDWISVDGTTGEVFLGEIESVAPSLDEQTDLLTLLNWADEIAATEGVREAKAEGYPTKGLQVWANADYPEDARRARSYGAQGIGLCRTEHMFFEPERLPIVQKMILAGDDVKTRQESLDKLLPYQRADFDGLFEAMSGYPVIIRLIDPPLHEFMPDERELLEDVIEARIKGEDVPEKESLLADIETLHESNPMMGLRGVRLSVMMPEIVSMQVRAIFEAAADVKLRGFEPHPEVMIPLTGHVNELHFIQPKLEEIAADVMKTKGVEFTYKFGTMIEIPRAGLTADEIAKTAEFFSFGTNDLTQFTFGYSRDDAERNFLVKYVEDGILEINPFQTIDRAGVGQLMDITVEKGRAARPDLECGICGEHGGDPNSIDWCHQIGLNYVSCSPFRVPIARLAAGHAALEHRA